MTAKLLIKAPPNIGDSDFQILAMMNASMTHLDISGCTKITNASLPIIESLAFLRHVNISGSGIDITNIASLFKHRDVEVVLIDKTDELFRSMKPYDI